MPPQQIIFTNTDIDIEKLKWKEYLNSEIQVQKEMRKVMKEMDDEFGEVHLKNQSNFQKPSNHSIAICIMETNTKQGKVMISLCVKGKK